MQHDYMVCTFRGIKPHRLLLQLSSMLRFVRKTSSGHYLVRQIPACLEPYCVYQFPVVIATGTAQQPLSAL